MTDPGRDKKITLNISDMSIEVCKKRIKNMHLYVKPPNGKVTVSAPLSMRDEAVERFVRAKLGWVKRQIAKFDAQARQSEREHVSGETLQVWGKPYALRTGHGNHYALVLSGDQALLTVRRESTAAHRESFIREWLRGQLKAEVARLLPKWEQKTGLACAGWQTKHMVTRWGTCNTRTRKIWLNLQLAKQTPECLEYVILHELAHLAEKKHNERFASLMDRHMPIWREVKATLNRQILDPMK